MEFRDQIYIWYTDEKSVRPLSCRRHKAGKTTVPKKTLRQKYRIIRHEMLDGRFTFKKRVDTNAPSPFAAVSKRRMIDLAGRNRAAIIQNKNALAVFKITWASAR